MLVGDYFVTCGWRGAWIVYENAKLTIKNQFKQLVSRGMKILVMWLVGYGTNDNSLTV